MSLAQFPTIRELQAQTPLGLSIDHKRPRPYLAVARGGQLCEVVTRGWKSRLASHAVRGAVLTYSARSSRRAFKTFASIDRRAVTAAPLFMTLTYPSDYPGDPKILKAHLFAFWKRLTRKYPWVSAFWRVELQQRGAPHYHLLIFGLSFLRWQWVAQNWAEVVGSGSSDHLNAGTEIRASLSWNTAGRYVAKYIAKVDEDAPAVNVGRHWGILGRRNFPQDIAYYLITEPLFFAIQKTLIELVTGGKPETWLGGPYSGVWANLPGYRPPPDESIPLDNH